MSLPLLFLLLEELGGESSLSASLGGFTFEIGVDNVVPGSDTGWNRQLSISQSRPLGSARDRILVMALGSHTRSFTLRTTPARFLLLQARQGATMTFVDWSGDSRPVYVLAVTRQNGSRPFRVECTVDLVEQ